MKTQKNLKLREQYDKKIIVNVEEGSKKITIPTGFFSSLKEKDEIIIFGAGDEYPIDLRPAKPEVVPIFKKPTDCIREYKIVVLTEMMGYSPPSESVIIESPQELDEDNFIIIRPKPVEEAYHHLIYGRKYESRDELNKPNFKLMGAINAAPFPGPHRLRSQAHDFVSLFDYSSLGATYYDIFIDKIGEPILSHKDFKNQIVYELDSDTPLPANLLRTRITKKIKGRFPGDRVREIKIKNAPKRNLPTVRIYRDNFRTIQTALDDTTLSYICLPKGIFPVFGNLRLSKRQIKLQGILPNTANLVKNTNGTLLEFQCGFSFVLLRGAANSVIQDISFKQIFRKGPKKEDSERDDIYSPIPAGGFFISNTGVQGCGVLALGRATWKRCDISFFNGVGHAIFGDVNESWRLAEYYDEIKRPKGNANLTYLEKCVSNANAGHGFYATGNNSNICLWFMCSATNNILWGFKEDSDLGSNILSCHTEANKKGAYSLDGRKRDKDDTGEWSALRASNSASTLIASYSENLQPPIETHHTKHIVIGGMQEAGISPDKTKGLVKMGRRVLPFTIRQGEIELQFGDKKQVIENFLQRFILISDPKLLDNRFVYNTSVNKNPRIDFTVGSQPNVTTGMSWSIKHPRGDGLMIFNRGFLLGKLGGFNQQNKTNSERKFLGIKNENDWENEQYQKGDTLVDLSGENYFLFPKEDFKLTDIIWVKDTEYNKGDVITYRKKRYYVAEVNSTNGNKGLSGTEQNQDDWKELANGIKAEIIDNELTWKKWKNYERLGRIVKDIQLEIIGDNLNIEAGALKDFPITVIGAQEGDSVVANPQDLKTMITWNVFIKENDSVTLRIQNHEPEGITVNLNWIIECWKH